MRVACPSCSAAYELPAALAGRLGEGRPLRCARCGHTWAPGAPPGPVPAPASGGPGVEAPAAPPPPAAPAFPPGASAPGWIPMPAGFPDRFPERYPGGAGPRPGVLAAAWAVSFLVLGIAAWAAVHWRVEIVAAWPPAARAFIALGLGG